MDTRGKAFIAEKTSQSAGALTHTYLPTELVEITARLQTYVWFIAMVSLILMPATVPKMKFIAQAWGEFSF